ncbi:MAG: CHRD domain-containing protein, partial [Bacteroidota bacterium]
EGTILGLPGTFSDVDFDDAGEGTCLVWHLSFEDGLEGAMVGASANDLSGCFSLSNPISVSRLEGDACEPITFEAILSGIQQNPPVKTDAAGIIQAELFNGILKVTGSFSGLEGTFAAEIGGGAHIHAGLPGANGGVEIGLSTALDEDLRGGTYSADNNTFTLTEQQIELLLTRGLYVNIHSSTSPSGEIRGQLLLQSDSYMAANLSGANQNDVVVSTGSGTVLAEIRDEEITFIGSFANLASDFAAEIGGGIHVHQGTASENGPVLLPLAVALDADLRGGVISAGENTYRTAAIGAEGITALMAGGTYVNIHTAENNPGEIRGQILDIDNKFPRGDFGITSPPDGAAVTIVPDGSAFAATWDADTDPDGVETVYTWQLAADPNFEAVVFQTKTGTATTFGTTTDVVDGLLASVGLPIGQPITVFHRAVASDGSVSMAGGSASVTLTRAEATDSCAVDGGTLEGGPFEFCAGDGEADNIDADAITLAGNMGPNNQWVITDADGNILGLPGSFADVNFDEAGPGTCLVWHLSFEDGLTGAAVGANAGDLEGCFDLSNPIEVVRNQPDGGTLEGGPFEFNVGDGIADTIAADAITLTGNTGPNNQWVITDDEGMILGLPSTFSAVNFDDAGPGTCLVWHLSFEDGLTGAEVGANAADLGGCFDLSNPIEVVRVAADDCTVDGGTLEGGPFEFCAGDGEADNIDADAITLDGNTGPNNQWVITDADGNILGLPGSFADVNFDEAGPGTCLVWHLSFEDGLTGAEVGANAADLGGCFDLSNPIEVVRNQPDGGTLEGGPFEFCAGDGEADNIDADAITLTGNTGPNNQWVITDADGNILGLPGSFADVNFDKAGPGTCLVWHLSFEDGLTGAEVGANAADLGGCFDLSNPIEVVRNQPDGGTLEGGPFEFNSIGDGEPDMIPEGSITLTDAQGESSQWVVTDSDGFILGLPPMPSAVDFDGAGAGTCLIWHLSFDGELGGAMVGANAADLEGCFDLSNPIEVIRRVEGDCQANGGDIFGGPFEFNSIGDGEPDMIP